MSDEHEPLVVGQFVECRRQLVDEHGSGEGGVRTRIARRKPILERHRPAVDDAGRLGRRDMAPRGPEAIDDAVVRHPREPGAQALDGLEEVHRLDPLQQNLLQDVLDIGGVVDAPADESAQACGLLAQGLGEVAVVGAEGGKGGGQM